ncbi:MAG: cyclic nucleotide-binding/CBS domain-containing protein [Candidatus Hermodarchaeota archaeon]
MEEKEVLIGNLLNSHQKRIISMPSSQPVAEAAKLMADNHVGSVIIKNDKIIGIITKGDIINRVVGRALDPGIIMAEDVMTKPVSYVSSDESLESTMLLMSQKNIERILVVADEDLSKPLGVISTNDILKFAPGMLRIHRERLLIKTLPEEVNHTTTTFRGFCDDCKNYSENLSTTNGYTLCPECTKSLPDDEEPDEEIM